ncbi:uncharacterized protein LOC142175357 [Nicotiana tabacum]|uniref:Uncharacterized protein LOC142175357 n=1 Tax=Nicotiana tabacum TaxID=4097 RepID=A0AC58TLE4_TOBAC
MCAELEKNKQLHEELGRVKSDLEKSLKWTWSSNAITAMHTNNGGNMQGIGFQREKISYNPHSKYVTGTVKGCTLQWYMDSGCSRHMTGSTNDFLSLKVIQGGSVSFRNGKKGYILGLGRIGKTLSHSIENVYYVNGLKYGLLSVSQICDMGNKNGDLSCLSVVDNDAELWHRRLSHASFTSLNKLVRKNLVRGLPKSSFKDHKVASRGGKKYIFVIVDDYSRFTWTLFLRTKDETFEVFVSFVKKIQVKMGNDVACIRSDHGTEFDNAKFDEFCTENGEAIDLTNGKADIVSHVKKSSKDDAITPPFIGEEYGPLITPTEAENSVVDAIQVARMEAIRILITFASHMEFTLFQMDIKCAFLNGYLKEEVYVKQPPGFECHEHPEHVLKLDKALYGLKQAPRDWYERLSKFLLENGFTRGKIATLFF